MTKVNAGTESKAKKSVVSNQYNYYVWPVKIALSIVCLIKKIQYNLISKQRELPQGGNLILSNHVTVDDQFFIYYLYKTGFIYMVAGENVCRNRFVRKFLEKYVGMIVHMRGMTALNTIKQMTGRLKEGSNVCIFPEGATTFDGKTKAVDASIAKVAKISNCNMVLLTIEGGYLSHPRWAKTTRTGRLNIKEHIVTKEELKSMSAVQISNLINDKLYTDAYEEQRDNLTEFIGKKPCHGLECCIYRCPGCEEITGLSSLSHSLICKCGYKMHYDKYGCLVDDEGGRYTIAELCNSQTDDLRKKLLSTERILLFGDELDCSRVYPDGKRESLGKVRLDVYTDGTEYTFCAHKGYINHEDVDSVFIFIRNTMNCRLTGKNHMYEMTGGFSFNALKYRDLFDIISNSNQ